jgi:flagellar FliJ protein
MKFKFALEKVLKHKKILEDQAKKDFSIVATKLHEQEQFLVNLETDLRTAYENKFQIQQSGGTVAAYLEFFHHYYISQKKLIENQKKIIEGLEKILEEKRLYLVQMAREHKTFIMLREKKKAEFKKELNKREQKRLDEMNIMRQELREKAI